MPSGILQEPSTPSYKPQVKNSNLTAVEQYLQKYEPKAPNTNRAPNQSQVSARGRAISDFRGFSSGDENKSLNERVTRTEMDLQ